MNILCPFCLTEHDASGCEKNGEIAKTITQKYINALKNGAEVCPIAFIGYKGSGKTTYLSSLIYSLFHSLPSNWISILPLNQETLDKVKVHIPRLRRGNFPPPTQKFIEEPLILKIKKRGAGFFTPEKEIILIIYDTMGGTYDSVSKIKDNFQLIKNIPNIILLADLFSMCTENKELSLDMKLHSLVTKLTLALAELDASAKEKNLIICFTKSDSFWYAQEAEEHFGPFSVRPEAIEQNMKLHKYVNDHIWKNSEDIESFIENKCRHFFATIKDEYGGYCFVASSNIGSIHNKESNTFENFEPVGVVDPLLWILCL